MSTNTIESVKTSPFRLTYAHGAEHHILNDQSSFAWDCLSPTGRLNGVVTCAGGSVNVDMTQNGNVWTGSYSEAGQTFTLRISNFNHEHDEEKIAGDIKRCHKPDSGVGSDDMGSFTGTKTRLTAPAAR